MSDKLWEKIVSGYFPCKINVPCISLIEQPLNSKITFLLANSKLMLYLSDNTTLLSYNQSDLVGFVTTFAAMLQE